MSFTTLWFGIIGATGLMRLIEVAVSRGRIARHPEDLVKEPRLFPAMVLLHFCLIFLPIAEVLFLGRSATWLTMALGGGLLVFATVLRVWALKTLGKSWNVQVVKPSMVVTGGPYAFIRHPNYLVVIVEIIALPLLHGALISLIFLTLFNAVVLWVRIKKEEETLALVPGWSEAMATKARLIPGVF